MVEGLQARRQACGRKSFIGKDLLASACIDREHLAGIHAVNPGSATFLFSVPCQGR